MKIISKIAFAFRFTFKNIIKYPFQTLVLLFSFLSLFIITLLGFSIRPIIESYYYEKTLAEYQDIDFYLSVNENSQMRYFSIRHFNENYEVQELFSDVLPFFEIQTLVGFNDKKIYVTAMASSIDSFKKTTGIVNYSKELAENEVIITESLARKYQLNINESLILYVGESYKSFEIVEIVIDDGLFTGNKIYLNKEYCISFFLSALNPTLGNLKPIFFKNLYNRIYFEVNDEVDIEFAKEQVLNIDDFKSLEITNVLDYENLKLIDRNITIFLIIISFIFLAIFSVMQTTFQIVFEEKRKTFSIIALLGGTKLFSFVIIIIEIAIVFIFSFLISIKLANFIINQGLIHVGINATYNIKSSAILSSALILIAIFLITVIYYFVKFNKKTAISQTSEVVKDYSSKRKYLFASLSLVFILYMVIEVSNIRENYPSFILIQTALLFLGLFLITFVLLSILQFILNKLKIDYFNLHFKMLFSNKIFYYYTSIMLVCFVSIIFMVSAYNYQMQKAAEIEEEYQIDFALTNFVSRFDMTFNEVKEFDEVEHASAVLMYKNVYFIDNPEKLKYFISLNSEDMDYYFNYNIDKEITAKLLTKDIGVIILPERFHQLYGLGIGDTIKLSINQKHSEEEFEIIGFFDTQSNNIAFSNMISFEKYESEIPNAIFVNARGETLGLKEKLINRYSKNIIYVLDFKEIVNEITNEIKQVINYVSYIIVVIIVCFILSIFNCSILLFQDLQNNYSRIIVLGFSKRKLVCNIVLEQLLIFFVYLFVSMFCLIIFSNILPEVIIFWGEYEKIYLSPEWLIVGGLLCLFVYMVTRIFYMIKLILLNPIDIIKSY